MKLSLLLPALALSCQSAAFAQSYSVEELASITDQHAARIDMGSTARNGDMISFDVRVDWKIPAERPEGAALVRTVRYLVRCEEKEMAVGMVTLYNEYRQVAKRVGVPPGAWEFSKPAKGSRESRWVEDVCDLPL